MLQLDLSFFRAGPSSRLGPFPIESDRAFPAQCCVPSARIVEAVYVVEDRHLSRPPRWPGLPPDQLGLDCFEEGLHRGVVITISFASHRHSKAVPTQGHGHVQCPDRQVPLHPVADRPADHPA